MSKEWNRSSTCPSMYVRVPKATQVHTHNGQVDCLIGMHVHTHTHTHTLTTTHTPTQTHTLTHACTYMTTHKHTQAGELWTSFLQTSCLLGLRVTSWASSTRTLRVSTLRVSTQLNCIKHPYIACEYTTKLHQAPVHCV